MIAKRGRYALPYLFFLLFLSGHLFLCESKAVWENGVEFPSVAWVGPPLAIFSDTVMRDFANAGYTIDVGLLGDPGGGQGLGVGATRAQNLSCLDIAARNNVKLILTDNRFGSFGYGTASVPCDSAALKRIDSIVDDYKNHPGYFGFFLCDEPNPSAYPSLRKVKDRILERDSNHLVWLNLSALNEADVTAFMDTVRPQMLSFDAYPITTTGCADWFFETLERFRRISLKYSVPLWAFANVEKLNGWPVPTEGSIGIQQYSNLAYGAKGLESFNYGWGANTAILSNGAKTPIYYVLQKVNVAIMKIAPLMAKLTSIGVSHATPLPTGTTGFSTDSCIQYTTGTPILAGWFKDSTNQRYVMLVNREYLVPGNTRLFTKGVTGLVEVSKQTGAELPSITPTGNNITLDFRPGEGRLFRVVTGALADAGKPAVDTICAMPPDSVVVIFNKRVSRTTAESAANYIMNKGIQVNSARLRADSVTVVLSTTALARDTVYALQVSNVQDLSGHAMDAASKTLKWNSCVLDWSLDEGAGDTVHDGSGLGNTGYRFWDADWQDGKFGKSINFAGGNVKARPDAFTHVVNTFTIMLWVKPTQTRPETEERNSSYYWGTVWPYTITPYGGDMYGVDNAGAGLSVGTNGVSVCELDGDAPYPYHSPTLLVYPTPIADWTHVAVVYDHKVTKLYINGALVRTGLTSVKTVHPSGQLGISYNGGVDEYKVFSYALSQSEIAALMQAGSSVSVHAAIPRNAQLKVWPSPFSGTVQMNVSGSIGSNAKLLIYDISGKLLEDLSASMKDHTIAWQPALKGSGVYIVKLVQGNRVTSTKISALR